MNGTGFNGWLPVSGVSAAVRSSSLNELIDTVLIIQHRASQSLLTNYYLTKGFSILWWWCQYLGLWWWVVWVCDRGHQCQHRSGDTQWPAPWFHILVLLLLSQTLDSGLSSHGNTVLCDLWTPDRHGKYLWRWMKNIWGKIFHDKTEKFFRQCRLAQHSVIGQCNVSVELIHEHEFYASIDIVAFSVCVLGKLEFLSVFLTLRYFYFPDIMQNILSYMQIIWAKKVI